MDHRSIIDGSHRGFRTWLARGGLYLGSLAYGRAVAIRNRRYDRRRELIHRVSVPVISVGNLTAGGTGKTPMVAALAAHLRQRGKRVALVSRGYGSDQTGVNDEARELYDVLPDVPHIQDPDRVEACRIAVEELDMQAVVLDDGFQHRRLHRDLDIVLVDATCPFGFDYLLPRGLLREPVANVARADLIVLTRAGRVAEAEREQILQRLRRLAPDAVFAQCDHRPKRLIGQRDTRDLDWLDGKTVAAFAGIGNPEPFFRSLVQLGATVIDRRPLPDHCGYGSKAVADLIAWLQELQSAHPNLVAICTHKDLVKLRTTALGSVPLWALSIEMQLTSGGDAFWAQIDRTVADA
jgi:tetraacyldisaccharide 4'-kinase